MRTGRAGKGEGRSPGERRRGPSAVKEASPGRKPLEAGKAPPARRPAPQDRKHVGSRRGRQADRRPQRGPPAAGHTAPSRTLTANLPVCSQPPLCRPGCPQPPISAEQRGRLASPQPCPPHLPTGPGGWNAARQAPRPLRLCRPLTRPPKAGPRVLIECFQILYSSPEALRSQRA